MNEKVSIILPVYNGEKYISEAIESIIDQTYKNFELIIINDCSTDNTLELCNSYADKDQRIKVFSNETNLKLPNSLNAGFERASGYYYTWTSDDNIYKPNAIETMIRELKNNRDLVMVYSNYAKIDSNGDIIENVKLRDSRFLTTGNVCGACFLYTADVAKKVGKYDATLFLAEDYDYWIRIYKEGNIKHLLDNLYCYRVHSGSLTATRREQIIAQTYKTLEKNFDSLYCAAQRDNLVYSFFDFMLTMGKNHEEETKEMLVSKNKGYLNYLKRKENKEALAKKVRGMWCYNIMRKIYHLIAK